jgi:uncharacterized protein (TIGR02172 family)
VFAWGEVYILKLYRAGYPAREAEREAAQARVAHAAGLKTPAVIELVTVEDRYGIVYERVDGPTMMQTLMRNPAQFQPMAALLAELQATMHTQQVSGLARQRQRLQQQIQRAELLTSELKTGVLAFLEGLPDDQVLCHGDFHPENILMTAEGPVIIDWVDASQGNPLADVARTSLLFRLGELPPHLSEAARQEITKGRQLLHETYLERYLQLRQVSLEALKQWEVPVAAARLSEGISSENEALLAIVRSGLGL